VIQAGPSLGNGGGVGQHADGSLDFGKITTGDNSRRLQINATTFFYKYFDFLFNNKLHFIFI
jgi:hypothetical protein